METTVAYRHFFGRSEVRGFLFTLIGEGKKATIWEVNTGTQHHYGVWKRKWNKRFGVESKPSSKAFGSWAWCYSSWEREKAFEKFNELNK